MMALSQRMETVLRELYHPDGINLGMNIGKAAGAGIAGHIHMHVLPRWVADANCVGGGGDAGAAGDAGCDVEEDAGGDGEVESNGLQRMNRPHTSPSDRAPFNS